MSKTKRSRRLEKASAHKAADRVEAAGVKPYHAHYQVKYFLAYVIKPTHWWLIALVIFISLGVLGVGLKYLEESARSERARLQQDPSAKGGDLLAGINPFLSPPPPSPTPQLSKEYIYAGSRMLAVEDAHASAIPPTDLAFWRPSNGNWYCLGGAAGSQGFQAGWGTNGDQPAPGDYDGDGKTDLSIFRPSTGTWWIYRSSDSTYYTISPLGTTSDVVAQADFDGDGKTDPAVFRSSTQSWYIYQSSTSSSVSAQFGATGDAPAAADYDGDGKADIATWRNSNLTFYYYSSSLSQQQTQGLGSSGTAYTAVPGDYDGDGKADFALFSAGSWIVKPSGGGSNITLSWGTAGDIAVQNDYDGDGKCDFAIWRPSTGYWWIVNSHDSTYRANQWGQNGDIPVPALYRR
jgi:FG-GAP-like repeat